VIGYGNPLRGDDSIGHLAASDVAARGLAHVRVLTVHQLTPELAEPLAEAALAVFVDATHDPWPDGVCVRPVEAADSGACSASMSHVCDPPTLLALARSVYGRAPRSWQISVSGESFDFGRGLSRQAARGVSAAASTIVRIVEQSFAPAGQSGFGTGS
jgi:hydrogenase maturation protease